MDTFSLPQIACIAGAALTGALIPAVVTYFAPGHRISVWFGVLAMTGLAAWSAVLIPGAMLLALTIVLGWSLLVLATIDALVLRLPDAITLPLIAAGLSVSFLLPDARVLLHALAGAIAFAGLELLNAAFLRLRGQHGLGMGDSKLAAAAGTWLGLLSLPFILTIAAFGGLLLYAVAALRRGASSSEAIPFGVPLSFAIWLTWLYGPLF